MKRLLILSSLLLTLSAPVYAEGRAACRFVFGEPGGYSVCYAEQVLWRLGGIETGLGVEYRYPGTPAVYSLLLADFGRWWGALEIARSGDWRFGVSLGLRW